jgi:hypothetical protein
VERRQLADRPVDLIGLAVVGVVEEGYVDFQIADESRVPSRCG